MLIGGKDRTYYRAESNETLIEEAKYYPNVELCLVLAERLEVGETNIKEAEALRNGY